MIIATGANPMMALLNDRVPVIALPEVAATRYRARPQLAASLIFFVILRRDRVVNR